MEAGKNSLLLFVYFVVYLHQKAYYSKIKGNRERGEADEFSGFMACYYDCLPDY